MVDENTVDLNKLYVELGGAQVKGLGADGVTIPSLPEEISEQVGLDTVAFIRKHRGSMVLNVPISLNSKSKSIKVLKAHALAGTVVPFRVEHEDIGLYFEALECVVIETGETKIDGNGVSDAQFTIKCKNFVKLLGLN